MLRCGIVLCLWFNVSGFRSLIFYAYGVKKTVALRRDAVAEDGNPPMARIYVFVNFRVAVGAFVSWVIRNPKGEEVEEGEVQACL